MRILPVVFCLILLASCSKPTEKTSLANPASVHCIDQGGKLEIRTAEDGAQTGYCTLPNGKVCEEWAYFRKEC